MGRTIDDDPDAELFSAAVAGARPIARQARIAPPRPAPLASARRPTTGNATRRFQIERDGERVRGHAGDDGQLALHRIESDVEPSATIDLHGLTAVAAERAVVRFVGESTRQRHRVVLIVHGRGLHSDGAPVLREAALDALAGPLSGTVLAFATAARRHGGPGALYAVLKF